MPTRVAQAVAPFAALVGEEIIELIFPPRSFNLAGSSASVTSGVCAICSRRKPGMGLDVVRSAVAALRFGPRIALDLP